MENTALAHLQKAVAALRDAETDLREAVLHARLQGCTWAQVADALDITRQAVSARFGLDDTRMHLVTAWTAIEHHLAPLAEPDEQPMQTLARLANTKRLRRSHMDAATALWRARNDTIHGGMPITEAEADQLTDGVIPLTAALYEAARTR